MPTKSKTSNPKNSKMDKLYSKRYRVKYTDYCGVVHYGYVNRHHPEAEKWAKQDQIIINDAITGRPTRVPVKIGIVDIPFTLDNIGKDDEFDKYVNSAFKKAQKLSDSIKGFGVGKLFSVGVADGCAYYVVTKVNKKTAHVEWRGFHPDLYYDQILGGGGSFPRDTIEHQVACEEGLRKLFSKKEKK